MLVCDLPCDECGDVTMPKFCAMGFKATAESGELLSLKLEIYCPEHNAGKTETVLLREGVD